MWRDLTAGHLDPARNAIDSEAPAMVIATTTNNAPGSEQVGADEFDSGTDRATSIAAERAEHGQPWLTRTKSMVGGITLGVTALRSTNDFENTIMASAQGLGTPMTGSCQLAPS